MHWTFWHHFCLLAFGAIILINLYKIAFIRYQEGGRVNYLNSLLKWGRVNFNYGGEGICRCWGHKPDAPPVVANSRMARNNLDSIYIHYAIFLKTSPMCFSHPSFGHSNSDFGHRKHLRFYYWKDRNWTPHFHKKLHFGHPISKSWLKWCLSIAPYYETRKNIQLQKWRLQFNDVVLTWLSGERRDRTPQHLRLPRTGL